MRRFESPSRFWEIDLRWSEYTVRRGPKGGEAETRRKSFPDAATAARAAEELIEEKLAEGYVEIGAVARLPEPEPEPPPPPPAPVPAAPPPPPPPPAPAPAAAPPPPPAAAKTIARRFEFVEGDSRKFWEVEVAGSRYTVRFGRIGTKGQTRTTSFADPAAAVREAAKLIHEKTSKGYVEITQPKPPP